MTLHQRISDSCDLSKVALCKNSVGLIILKILAKNQNVKTVFFIFKNVKETFPHLFCGPLNDSDSALIILLRCRHQSLLVSSFSESC